MISLTIYCHSWSLPIPPRSLHDPSDLPRVAARAPVPHAFRGRGTTSWPKPRCGCPWPWKTRGAWGPGLANDVGLKGPKPWKEWGKRADFGGQWEETTEIDEKERMNFGLFWEISWKRWRKLGNFPGNMMIFWWDSLEETREIDLQNWNFGVLPFKDTCNW